MNELERMQNNNRLRKRKKEDAEEIYWDIRARIGELIKGLPEHWDSPGYFRQIDEFEEDMFCGFQKIEAELNDEEEQIEKERKELIRQEEAYRYEYQKEVQEA